MDIREFMAKKCPDIFDSFANLPRLNIHSLRLELAVRTTTGLIYHCQFLSSNNPYSDEVILECHILFESDDQKISIDCSQLPMMGSVDDYLMCFDQFELLEKRLNFEYMINH
ncbi:hypothetical protein [Streptococcus saliviloxodontae]|uniref:Uncharacterized protein n=1 Tax=Streptococcus saliviloxodontae TaxID=1349416 RepID=A0ABS2PLD9_9STRE|nr:hypothetical protein [Streptococcus saliviloxodontae]MBM7636087.1 hypothetical protein [Streptococcus saliviloxodontae]